MNDRFTDDPYADREALASLLEQAEGSIDGMHELATRRLERAEQAERERDEARKNALAFEKWAEDEAEKRDVAEARLAKVPALVADGKHLAKSVHEVVNQAPDELDGGDFGYELGGLYSVADEYLKTLATWEEE